MLLDINTKIMTVPFCQFLHSLTDPQIKMLNNWKINVSKNQTDLQVLMTIINAKNFAFLMYACMVFQVVAP